MHLERFYKRAKNTYLASPEAFIDHRLKYYADALPIPTTTVTSVVYPRHLSTMGETGADIFKSRQNAIDRLQSLRAKVVIVTATKNRVHMLDRAYAMLDAQKGFTNWVWLVVDNESTDNTKEYIESLKDSRIVHVPYVESTGYAYPARNFGMYLVHAALYKYTTPTKHMLMLDSDDHLDNEHSLHELMKMTTSAVKPVREQVLSHGIFYKVRQTEENTVHLATLPHDVDSSFPIIPSLREMKTRGQVISAGIFPTQLLSFLRYPSEFSFEDTGLNHKLFLYALKHDMIWLAEPYPIVTKILHRESMTALNNQLGSEYESDTTFLEGPSGVRVQILEYMKKLYDYFTRENL